MLPPSPFFTCYYQNANTIEAVGYHFRSVISIAIFAAYAMPAASAPCHAGTRQPPTSIYFTAFTGALDYNMMTHYRLMRHYARASFIFLLPRHAREKMPRRCLPRHGLRANTAGELLTRRCAPFDGSAIREDTAASRLPFLVYARSAPHAQR